MFMGKEKFLMEISNRKPITKPQEIPAKKVLPFSADFKTHFTKPLEQDVFEYKGQSLTLNQIREKSYKDVYRHEAAHLNAAGKYAASGIIIDYDKNGIATGGHVNIKMPTLNKNNIDETITHAETVYKAATAPSSFDELSTADKTVAAKSQNILQQAKQYKNTQKQKSLNILA